MTRDVEQQMSTRGEVSEKQQIIQLMEKAFTESLSEEEFYQNLNQHGFTIYSYRGKAKGIKGRRKYRFRTLGFNTMPLQKLGNDLSRNKRLETMIKVRNLYNSKDKDRLNHR